MQRIIECVPNFSEGRDLAKIEAIIAAMREVPGVIILDRESDSDHNRSVVTLAGEPEAVAEAALRAVGKAHELIDLTQHTGAHPRIGATDVVPFIPVEGVELQDCIALAHRVGGEIWDRYHIPVYFYEAAAERPGRTNLEDIRKGQFEGLSKDVQTDPNRAPDIGEPALHPTAGATVVGARKFLIAYNINLDTPDVKIANKIARAIRHSSGGLRYVKSMGVELRSRGLAQVSINLTDFEQTPMHRVFEMVHREAERYGCRVVGSEIVGLIPKKALEMTADFFLQLEDFKPEMVFENRLAAAIAGAPVEQGGTRKFAAMATPLLDAVAAPTPTPGGGSVSALVGALAAALGQMVAGLARKKKSHEQYMVSLTAAVEELDNATRSLAASIDRDAAAFDAVRDAFKLPHETAEQEKTRAQAIDTALQGAAEVPMEVAEASMFLFELLGQLQAITPASMKSDLQVGRMMAAAAAHGALANVDINLESITDANFLANMRARRAAVQAAMALNPAAATAR
jgi:glutamate formiminotransferase / formiminotetrahydrofolate cyclodeaminase